ncbi:trypsin-like peptidase domain-containing protein [Candidatus Bipolaricaulota bacterium]
MRKGWLIGLIFVVLVGTGITVAWIETSDTQLAVGTVAVLAQDDATTASSSLDDQITASGQSAVKQAIAAVGPAVVRIDITGTTSVSDPFSDFFSNPFFRDFFGDRFESDPEERTTQSLGSGVVIAYGNEKLVLTNAHVVDNADTITVSAVSGESWDASVVGADDVLDVAILRLDGETDSLATAELGDSESVEIGDWAIAIGNPLGLSYSVTLGIISATDRDIAKPTGIGNFNNLLQTDAAINPGNSGGPLVNAYGDVIGLNTMIARSSSNGVTIEGINFAIAINSVKDVLAQLVETGGVVRGWLGVQHTEITLDVAEAYGIDPEQTGTVVVYVYPDNPADVAGLQEGDVVIDVGGATIESSDDLNREIGILSAGSEIDITVIRDGETLVLTALLGERPSEETLAFYSGPAPDEESDAASFLGLVVRDITPIIANQLGLNSTDGVVIMDVAAGSRAEQAGLAEGDVILEVDHVSVESVEDWDVVITDVGDARITLTILRNGRLSFVTVE